MTNGIPPCLFARPPSSQIRNVSVGGGSTGSTASVIQQPSQAPPRWRETPNT